MIKFVLLSLCVFLIAADDGGKNATEATQFGIRRLLKDVEREETFEVDSRRKLWNKICFDVSTAEGRNDHEVHWQVKNNLGYTICTTGAGRCCNDFGEKGEFVVQCRDHWHNGWEGYKLFFNKKQVCTRLSRYGHYDEDTFTVTNSGEITIHPKVSEGGWLKFEDGKYYINLNGENYSEYYPTRTVYKKVQLVDPPRKGDRTVRVNINNPKFAQTTNGGKNGHSFEFMPWGKGMDCRWGRWYQSPLSIDLEDTPFAVSSGFPAHNPAGWYPHGEVTCSRDRKRCTGSCGGYCGYCGADDRVPLVLDVKDQALFDRYAL